MAYSDDTIAETLALLAAYDGNAAKTSRKTGIPSSTIRRWRDQQHNPPTDKMTGAAENSARKKAQISERLEELVHTILDLAPDKAEEADFRQLLTSLGIAIDKIQLLRGEATEITEQRNVEHIRDQIQRKLHRVADAQRN